MSLFGRLFSSSIAIAAAAAIMTGSGTGTGSGSGCGGGAIGLDGELRFLLRNCLLALHHPVGAGILWAAGAVVHCDRAETEKSAG